MKAYELRELARKSLPEGTVDLDALEGLVLEAAGQGKSWVDLDTQLEDSSVVHTLLDVIRSRFSGGSGVVPSLKKVGKTWTLRIRWVH
jgi:hypothetical protein